MQVHLVTMWTISHLVFAGCMFATYFTHSVWGTTIIITITGFSWAITQWAPFSLLAEAILTEPVAQNEVGSISLADTRTWPHHQQGLPTDEESERNAFLADDLEDEGEDEEARLEDRRRVLGNSGAQMSRVDISNGVLNTPTDIQNDGYVFVPSEQERGEYGSGSATSSTLSSKAGIILGIHNIFIVLPQFLVSGFAAILFALVDPQRPLLPGHRGPIAPGPVLNGTIPVAAIVSRGKEVLESLLDDRQVALDDTHSDSVVYVFWVGGVAASLAFILCWRLAREIRHR